MDELKFLNQLLDNKYRDKGAMLALIEYRIQELENQDTAKNLHVIALRAQHPEAQEVFKGLMKSMRDAAVAGDTSYRWTGNPNLFWDVLHKRLLAEGFKIDLTEAIYSGQEITVTIGWY